MFSPPRGNQLRVRLADITEFDTAGFSAREGLTGAGITILKGRTYFGSWRESQGKLLFVSANPSEPHFAASSVDEALRQTMLMILRSLEAAKRFGPVRASAG